MIIEICFHHHRCCLYNFQLIESSFLGLRNFECGIESIHVVDHGSTKKFISFVIRILGVIKLYFLKSQHKSMLVELTILFNELLKKQSLHDFKFSGGKKKKTLLKDH